MKSDCIETGRRDAKNPVFIAGVPSPSSSRVNFCLPTPFQFTTLKKEINITWFFYFIFFSSCSVYFYRNTRENLG